MNESHIYRYETSINEDTQLNLYSLLVAIFAVGGMLGGLLAGWWADFFGRCVIIHVERIKHIRRPQEIVTQIAEIIHVLYCIVYYRRSHETYTRRSHETYMYSCMLMHIEGINYSRGWHKMYTYIAQSNM